MGYELLLSEEFIVFSTRAFAVASGVSLSAATRQLGRYAARGLLVRLTRGIWANTKHPYFSPLCAVPALLGTEQGYVSFLTALHLHGIVSQIPATTQIATTGPSRLLRSPIGQFEFFHIQPRLMTTGVMWSETRCPYRIATPEKALLDTLYLSTRKGRRFRMLPELELGRGFNQRRFARLLTTLIHDVRIRSAVQQSMMLLRRAE